MNKLPFVLLLLPLVILGPLAVDVFLPALPIMANALNATPIEVQWTITVYMFSLGVGQLIFGPISDRLGRKPVLMFGLVIYLITAVAIALTLDYTLHIILRAIQGIGACAIMVTTFASVTDKFNETDSSKIYSYLNGIIFCIPALAPIVGYHITQHLGWHSNFLFMAMMAVPACVITMFYFSETKEKTDGAVYLPDLNTYKQVLVKPSFLFHAIAIMLAMATIMAFVSTAPNVFVYEFSASEQTFTFWFSLNATVTIVVSFIAAKLFSHFSLEKVIATGMMIVVTSGVLLLSFTNKGNLLSYILPVLLGTVGLALLLGAAIGKALALFNENVGLATAVLGFIQMSGAAFVVTLLQALNLAPINQVVLFSLSFLPLLVMYFIQRYRLQAKSVNSPQL